MNNLQRDEFIAKYELPTWKYNYKTEDTNERKFIHKLEDEIFEFQENVEIFDIISLEKENAKYKLDEDLYPVENENEEFILETDPKVVERQEKALIERMLAPRTQTLHERIYDMPEPFNHWDSRSFWHQFFFIEDKEENKCKYVRGNSGSSSSREYNGRWTHSFAYAAKRDIKIPTFHLIYDQHNQLKHHTQYDEFKCLPYDVSGNYQSNRSEINELFSGCFIEVATKLEFN